MNKKLDELLLREHHSIILHKTFNACMQLQLQYNLLCIAWFLILWWNNISCILSFKYLDLNFRS